MLFCEENHSAVLINYFCWRGVIPVYSLRNSLYSTCIGIVNDNLSSTFNTSDIRMTLILVLVAGWQVPTFIHFQLLSSMSSYFIHFCQDDLDPGAGARMAVPHFSPTDPFPPCLRQSWEKSSNPEIDFCPPKNDSHFKIMLERF